MKKLSVLFVLGLMFVSTVCFGASLQSLSKKQLTQTVEEKTITTIALATLDNQLINNSASVYLNKQGEVSGKFANKPKNAPKSDKGTWSVKNNGALCVTWQHWNQAKPICAFAYQLKNALLLVNANTQKLETLVLEENIKTGDLTN